VVEEEGVEGAVEAVGVGLRSCCLVVGVEGPAVDAGAPLGLCLEVLLAPENNGLISIRKLTSR
jgi:hypothetical protein